MTTPTRDSLLARYRSIGSEAAEHTPAATLPAPAITPVHREVVNLLDELLGAVAPNAGPYAGMIKTFRRLEPMLLRDFAKSSPDQVQQFARYLGARLSAVGENAGAIDADSSPLAGVDQSQSA